MTDNSSIQMTNLYPLDKDRKWGYINDAGKIVIDYQFTYAGNFLDGVAWVYVGGDNTYYPSCKYGKWGAIDQNGNYIIEPQFDWLTGFHNGLARVCLGNIPSPKRMKVSDMDSYSRSNFIGSIGNIDRNNYTGQELNSKFGLVSLDGKIIFPPQFAWISHPRGTISLIRSCKNNQATEENNSSEKWLPNKWGIVDFQGNILCEPRFDEVIFDDSFNYYDQTHIWVKLDGETLVINKFGQVLYKLQRDYVSVNQFYDGVAWIELERRLESHPDYCRHLGSKWAVLDIHKGLTEVDLLVSKVTNLSNGMAWVIDMNSKLGLVDKNGRIIVEPVFEQVMLYPETEDDNNDVSLGHAWVRVAGKWGLVDKNWQYLLEPQYNGVFNDIIRGQPTVETIKSEPVWIKIDDKFAVVKRTGEIVCQPDKDYDYTEQFRGNFSEVRSRVIVDNKETIKFGIVDRQGQEIIKSQFHNITWIPTLEVFIVLDHPMPGQKYGLYDKSGKAIHEPKFTLLSPALFGEWLLVWLTGEQRGLMDKHGELLFNSYFRKVEVIGDLAKLINEDSIIVINTKGEIILKDTP